MMYHAQEKIINTPGSEITGMRGGIHNSVTRIVLKPTHMIGGYAQFSYGFNYYGTIGTNRDEFVVVRKMNKVDWLDDEGSSTTDPQPPTPKEKTDENSRTNRHGAEPGQVHRLPHLLGHLQERLDQPPRHGIRLVQQRRDQARHRLPQGMGKPGQVERRLGSQGQRQDRAAPGRQVEAADAHLRQPEPAARSTTTTSPSPSTTPICSRRPRSKAAPTARPRSLITGKRMEKIVWGPNWEEILGGEFSKRSKDKNFDDIQKDIYGQFENTFMMYLPRLCEHCLNPACVAVCPSGSIYKREEDGIVLIDQDKCRGWRMCVSGCPYKKIYYNWKSGKAEKCIFCYPRIEAGQPTVCSETCVGRIRYLGVLLYDADRIQEAASVEHDRDLYQAQLDIFLDPNDPKVIEQARIDGIPDKWMEAARKSPVYKMAVDWKVALPLHPEYRTLPMVWYVPPLSPISAAANAGQIGINGEIPDVKQLRIPVKYLANLLTAGDTAAGGARAGTHAGHARLPARKACGWPHQHRGAGPGRDDPGRGGRDVPRDGDCQLRRPLRDPQHAPRVRREHLRRARRLRLLVRQRLLGRRQRGQPVWRHQDAAPFRSRRRSDHGTSTQRIHSACACWRACCPTRTPHCATHLPDMRARAARRTGADRRRAWPNSTR